jgi:hypothetical protein
MMEHTNSTGMSRRLLAVIGVFRGNRYACNATVSIFINVRIVRRRL